MNSGPLVIFDCDGVLVDSEPLANQVMAETLSEFGYPIGVEDCDKRFTGLPMADIIRAVEADLGRELPHGFADLIRDRDFRAFRERLQPMPHVREVLETLPYARCVASSGAPEKMKLTLSLSGLIDLLEPHLFSAHMVEKGKPAPDLLLFAAVQMDFRPRDCVVIEDSVAGIKAAAAAGMPVLGFIGGGHADASTADDLRAAGAAHVFGDFRQLLRLVADMGSAAASPAGLA